MHRVYRYVGPTSIAEHARTEPGGLVIRGADELSRAARQLGAASGEAITLTFVVDLDGELLVADRSSEHVACAGGRSVLAAGEIVVRGSCVESATNLSTGYCPEPACWTALASALDRGEIARPTGLAHSFIMRRCETCGARNVVKDDDFDCAECGSALPEHWNFRDP